MIDTLYPCPDVLTASFWEKKKGSLPPESELPGKLKALHRKHDAIDWKPFDAGWSKACKAAADLEQAFTLRDRNYRSSVFALKREAHELATAALRLAKEKSAAKPTVDAAKSIADAAARFAQAVDLGVESLKQEFDQARVSLSNDVKANAKGSAGDEGDDEAGNLLLDPQRLLTQLNLCKRDAARRVNFGFVEGHDKQPAVLALSPKIAAKKLLATLQDETGVKPGAFGTAWVEDTVLTLQLDKPLSGLVKKVRAPLQACGFRVTQVVIWNADGSVLEEEAQHDEPSVFAQRRAALQPRLLAALQGAPALATKLSAVQAFADEKAASGNLAAALQGLDMLEKLMGAVPAPAVRPPSAISATSARVAARASRLAWEQTRSAIRAELKRLEAVVLDEARDEPDFAEIQANSGVLHTVLDHLDERLTDKLDESLNAKGAAERRAADLQALELVKEYIGFARSDTLLADICANGFTDVPIRALLDERLNDLSTQLQRATAS